jgi:copper type II ascorbate-dependent monooxygenase-like protein
MRLVATLLLVACSTSEDPAATSRTVAMAMDRFTVMPGQEVWKCQDFANPFGGDAQVVTWRAHMAEGSHHLLVTQIDGAQDTAVTDCGRANLDGQVFDSQASESETAYPEGVAFAVPAGRGFRVEAHYLNAGDVPLEGAVTIEADVDDSGAQLIPAGPLLYTTADISIPPGGQRVTVTHTCTVTHDLTLFDAVSHMHRRGVAFTATAGATPIYQTTEYSHPQRKHFDPPLQLRAGDGVTFSCTYVNTGSTTIGFGQSADTDEMCALFGTYYPVPDGADPFLSCFVGMGPPPA